MTATGQRMAPRQRNTSSLRSIAQFFRGPQWMLYGTYVLFVVAVLTAAVSRAIAGLKPGEILLVLFVAALAVRRLVRKDFSFTVTPVDFAFVLIIAAGTLLPLVTAELRHIYITKDMISGLAGPIEYYLWYRVILETVPLPSRLPDMLRLIIIVISIISAIGVMQIFKFPGVENFLLKFVPTYETIESPRIHRATSLVGGWEILAAISAYAILLINQIQSSEGGIKRLSSWKYWNIALFAMLGFNVVALISTLSTAGAVAIVVGYLLAWRFNGSLAKATRYVLIVAVIGGIAVTPFLLERLAFQGHAAPTTANSTAIYTAVQHAANKFSFLPTTWASRATHWSIVLATVGAHASSFLFGVQPSFDYPVLSFGSTESLYLLLLYRGGIIYLLAFLAFAVIICRYIWQQRQKVHGFNRHVLTGILTVLIVNFSIDVLDAHFFSAGEWEIIITLLALAVGVSTQTDHRIVPVPAEATNDDRATAMRATAVRLPTSWDRRIQFSLAGVLALTLVASGFGFYKDRKAIPPPTALTVPFYDGTVLTALENQQLGTRAWQLTPNVDTTLIQGYANKVSAQPGDSVQLYISTRKQTSYDIAVYRIGWYMGLGGLLFQQQHIAQSQMQGNWTQPGGLQNCTTCLVDPVTHLVDANWARSATITIGNTWPSGVYLIKLVAAQGQSYIPLVVRESDSDTAQAQMLVNLPVNTYEAANPWGGYSMNGPATAAPMNPMDDTNPDRATQVSFNRPDALAGGAGDLLNIDIHSIRWLERSGYNLSYTTNIDVAEHPQSVLLHPLYIALGHDEYWTKSMRDGLEHARDVGISLAFFGANDSYWQARLAPDHGYNLDRTLVCYKVVTPNSDPSVIPNASTALALDPVYSTTPTLTTTRWRDPVLGRPENALLGIMYNGTIFDTPNYTYLPDWSVRSGEVDPLETAASIGPGDKISGGILGYAYDALATNGVSPINLSILGQSSLVDATMQTHIAETTYYRAPSGAMVFDAGSIWWGWGLDEFTFPGADQPNVLLGNQKASALTTTLLRTMLGTAHVPPPAAQAVQ